MIVDSSAIIAIFLQEDEADRMLRAINEADDVGVSTGTCLETGIVLSHRKQRAMQPALDVFLQQMRIESIPFTTEHRVLALQAWWRFGKTRSAAKLNYGNCIAYATAALAGRPLLYKGEDFSLTDIQAAKW